MTRDEAERIDRLTADIGDWRVQMKDDIGEAVRAHQAACLEMHLSPMQADLKWLVENAKRRAAEAEYRKRQRKRWLVGLGVVTPLAGVVISALVAAGVI